MEGDNYGKLADMILGISIHALRVEGDDIIMDEMQNATENFYPRPPGGGRRWYRLQTKVVTHFYPRPPGGGRLI